MELTFVTDLGNTFVVEIDANMELGNVMVLLEAEVSFTFNKHSSRFSDVDFGSPQYLSVNRAYPMKDES